MTELQDTEEIIADEATKVVDSIFKTVYNFGESPCLVKLQHIIDEIERRPEIRYPHKVMCINVARVLDFAYSNSHRLKM